MQATGCATPGDGHRPDLLTWAQLPPIPDREGFASPFAGISSGALLVAGGANFPERRPWEGGTKVWYDAVYALDRPDGTWRAVGRLPRPSAYGLSFPERDRVLCVGGADANGHFRRCYLLRLNEGVLVTEPMPDLPRPCAYAAGALAGDVAYVAGGIDAPAATSCLRTLWALDLRDVSRGWQELEPCPGPPRMLAVAGAAEGVFYLFSGASLAAGPDGKPVRTYLRDAWRYVPGVGWQGLPDLPRAAVAAPSPAPLIGGTRLLIISGDDGRHVGFKPEPQHPGFPRDILAFDVRRNTWSNLGGAPISRATVPTANWNGAWLIPNGEARPGYRSNEVWSLRP